MHGSGHGVDAGGRGRGGGVIQGGLIRGGLMQGVERGIDARQELMLQASFNCPCAAGQAPVCPRQTLSGTPCDAWFWSGASCLAVVACCSASVDSHEPESVGCPPKPVERGTSTVQKTIIVRPWPCKTSKVMKKRECCEFHLRLDYRS